MTTKLTKRQKFIVRLMQEGWEIFAGLSETTNREYFLVSKGFTNEYFNARVWDGLLKNGIIAQNQSPPFNWELTKLGKTIEL